MTSFGCPSSHRHWIALRNAFPSSPFSGKPFPRSNGCAVIIGTPQTLFHEQHLFFPRTEYLPHHFRKHSVPVMFYFLLFLILRRNGESRLSKDDGTVFNIEGVTQYAYSRGCSCRKSFPRACMPARKLLMQQWIPEL